MDDLDRLYHRLLDAVRESAPHLRERRFRLGDIPQHLLPYRLHRRDLGFESVQQYEGALARLAAGERGYLNADAAVQQAFRRAVDGGDVPLEPALRLHGDALVALAPEARHRPDTPAGAAPAVPAAGQAVPAASDAPALADAPAAPAATDHAAGASGLVIPIVHVEATGAEPGSEIGPAAPAASAAGAPAGTPGVGPPPVGPPPVGLSIDATPDVEAPAGGSPAPAAAAALAPAAASPASGPAAAPPAAPPSSPPAAMPFPVRPPTPVVGGSCRNCGRPLPTDRGVTFCPYCGENLTIRRCPACSTELETGWRFCITCGREVDELAVNAPNANPPDLNPPNARQPNARQPNDGVPNGGVPDDGVPNGGAPAGG